MTSRIDFNVTAKTFDRFIKNTSTALEKLIKIECGKKRPLSDSAYGVLAKKSSTDKSAKSNNIKINCSVHLKIAVNVIGCCELHDQYCEMYDPNKPRLRKSVDKHCIPKVNKNDPNVVNFQVRISKTGFNEYDLLTLLSLYPQAEDIATAVKCLFTEIMFIANNSKMNPHISSAGGKKSALPYFKGIADLTPQHSVQQFEIAPKDFNGLDTSKIKCTTIVEAFARTMAISLSFFDRFEKIYCGDNDFRFVNYYYVIDKWVNDFVDSVKEQFNRLASSSDKNREFKRLKELCEKVTAADRKDDRVAAAAALYIIINVSFSGNEKNAVSTRMKSFDDRFKKCISDLKYLSANMKKITYVKRDFRNTIQKFKDDPAALLILDPPYLKEFGLCCGDYSSAFTYEDMLDMFKLLKEAKCKVILFHSRSYWFDSTAVSYGMHKVGYYVGRNIGKKYKPYFTEVYSLNIDPSVEFFNPMKYGGLY